MANHPTEAIKRFEAMAPRDRKAALDALRLEALKRCQAKGLFFLQFVRTRDEADPDQAVKPFPTHYEYIRALWTEFDSHQKSIIAKSRQMMVSWIVCAYAVWWARHKPHQHVLVQTQKYEDAIKLVSMAGGGKDATFLGRCQFIERNLPAWLKVTTREGEGKISYENGSLIEAVAGGADQIRGKVASLVILDEFAYIEEARGVWTTLAPLVQKGMKLIIVSTPNGAEGSAFYHLYHGTPITTPTSHA